MESVTVFLNNQPAWHWWALGAILLAAEIASTTQYLLWPGIAALAIGLLKFVFPPLDGRLAVFLADASGHGLAPTLVVSQVRTSMQAQARAHAGQPAPS